MPHPEMEANGSSARRPRRHLPGRTAGGPGVWSFLKAAFSRRFAEPRMVRHVGTFQALVVFLAVVWLAVSVVATYIAIRQGGFQVLLVMGPAMLLQVLFVVAIVAASRILCETYLFAAGRWRAPERGTRAATPPEPVGADPG